MKAWITRIVDGDTLRAWIEPRPKLREEITIRLLGVDTPEMRGDEAPLGRISRQWVVDTLGHLDYVSVLLHKQDSFGRWLASVNYTVGDDLKDLSIELLDNGLAEPYSRSAESAEPIMDVPW